MNQILIYLTALLTLFYYKTSHRISSEHESVELAGDIAAFISKKMVQGLGLTTTELMLARMSAIKYAGKRDKPARLIDMMLRFGVDFLTITPLTQNQLQGLRECSSTHWDQVLAASDSEETDSSSDESEIAVAWDATRENETLPAQGTTEHFVTVTRHVDNLVRCYVAVERVTEVGSVIWWKENYYQVKSKFENKFQSAELTADTD